MPTSKELLRLFNAWFDYIMRCAELPMATVACKPVWTVVMQIAFGVGALIVLWLLWKFIKYRLDLRAAIRAQMERDRMPDAEYMERIKFKEVADVADQAVIADPQLAEKIRLEMERRRADNALGRNTPR